MGLIDFILNLAGVLLWLSWRSIGFDPLVKTSPATLIGTLRRAAPRRLKGWQLLAGLAALLVLRAVLYQQIGPEADWKPRLNLFFVVPPFRSHLFGPTMLFSVLSFARMLIVCYFWLLALAMINRRGAESDPLLKMLRLHLGPVARWPWPLQLLLPLLLIAGLWIALHPLLVDLEITSRVHSNAHLVEQGILIGTALYLSLQYVLPVFLFLHLIASYVYLGTSPLWDFVGATARNLLAPLHWLPLRIAKFDFAPLAGVILIFSLLHWLPNFILGEMARNKVSPWPQ
ncbi:MAG: hypothetical protein ABSD29_06855 [Verrucomicrobiota bacterium]|jgi:uncharacterized protein YggT (Ycf19 family)